MNTRNPHADWRAAVYAGIVAGVLATVVQVGLWLLMTDALPTILLRDARFAAAIVLGRRVLPPPASFDAWVMVVATFVHFALSIAYGLMLSALIARLRTLSSLLAGAAFGLCLYVINMYGFTTVFPWFEDSRDAISAAAHVAFGLVAAATYRALVYRRSLRSHPADAGRRQSKETLSDDC